MSPLPPAGTGWGRFDPAGCPALSPHNSPVERESAEALVKVRATARPGSAPFASSDPPHVRSGPAPLARAQQQLLTPTVAPPLCPQARILSPVRADTFSSPDSANRQHDATDVAHVGAAKPARRLSAASEARLRASQRGGRRLSVTERILLLQASGMTAAGHASHGGREAVPPIAEASTPLDATPLAPGSGNVTVRPHTRLAFQTRVTVRKDASRSRDH